MSELVVFLNGKMVWLLEHSAFRSLIGFLILLNPVALAPQVWVAITAKNVGGISLMMWTLFAFIQAAMALEGIRVESSSMFWSMGISFLESVTIICVVKARLRKHPMMRF